MVYLYDEVKRIRDQLIRMTGREEARRLKRQWILRGYRHQISFYGVVESTDQEPSQYRRIEVLSNVAYDEEIMRFLYEFFSEIMLLKTYTLFALDGVNGDLKPIGDFE